MDAEFSDGLGAGKWIFRIAWGSPLANLPHPRRVTLPTGSIDRPTVGPTGPAFFQDSGGHFGDVRGFGVLGKIRATIPDIPLSKPQTYCIPGLINADRKIPISQQKTFLRKVDGSRQRQGGNLVFHEYWASEVERGERIR